MERHHSENNCSHTGLPGTPVESRFGRDGRNRRFRCVLAAPTKFGPSTSDRGRGNPSTSDSVDQGLSDFSARSTTNCGRSVVSSGFSTRRSTHCPQRVRWLTSTAPSASRGRCSTAQCIRATVSPMKDVAQGQEDARVLASQMEVRQAPGAGSSGRASRGRCDEQCFGLSRPRLRSGAAIRPRPRKADESCRHIIRTSSSAIAI